MIASKNQKKTNLTLNHLGGQSSPYLLQHAGNPVDWYPWGQEALEKAARENKLLIISIGYSACHWCHVMEQQTFSDPDAAELMNDSFISIKVDREERPDIDQVYMAAAQLQTGRGGWPLNVVALPDGKPVVAGTYYPKAPWLQLLGQVEKIYEEDPARIIQSAANLTRGIRDTDLALIQPAAKPVPATFHEDIVRSWLKRIDFKWGGEKGAPKFPLPIGQKYLMHLYQLSKIRDRSIAESSEKTLLAVTTTLDRIAMGGVYDQVGGGISRYSTDIFWKIPHFEKMLYDNAQLISLYSSAYQLTGQPLYKRVVYRTIDFIERELTFRDITGIGFQASLDADSEGEEGKFYAWSFDEFRSILGDNGPLMAEYYNMSAAGNWEQGRNIPHRNVSDDDFALAHGIKLEDLDAIVSRANGKLFEARSQRIAPDLDDKIITAWNALMLKGLCDAFRAFGEKRFLSLALQNAAFLVHRMVRGSGEILRTFKPGFPQIPAFLDDYAFFIQAMISLYQATFDEDWLARAEKAAQYTLAHFFDGSSGLFYYTPSSETSAGINRIARKMEIIDNVIPASCSQMAVNLFELGSYINNDDFKEKAVAMAGKLSSRIETDGPHFANWALLLTYLTHPPVEVAIVGDEWQKIRRELDAYFIPNMLLMGGKKGGNLPGLKNRTGSGRTTIYVCFEGECRLPVYQSGEALKQLGLG